ncbi:MAG: hypothetical protein QM736_06735 [Vicinamibacterales bacterium]
MSKAVRDISDSNPLGSYKKPDTLVDRWDPIVATVGGMWDEWLGRGLDVWGASADADFHHENGDYWPCEFSSTWILCARSLGRRRDSRDARGQLFR